MTYYQELLDKASLEEIDFAVNSSTREEATKSFFEEFVNNVSNAGAYSEPTDGVANTLKGYRAKLAKMRLICQSVSANNDYEVWHMHSKNWNVCLTMVVYQISLQVPVATLPASIECFHMRRAKQSSIVHHVEMQGLSTAGNVFIYTGNIVDMWERFSRRMFVNARKKDLKTVRSNFGF